jgi:hypothetical protein
MSVTTTPAEVLAILEFSSSNNTPETQRTKEYLKNWIQSIESGKLIEFIQCVTGKWGITEGMCIQVFFSIR